MGKVLELKLQKTDQIEIMKKLESLSMDLRILSALTYEKPFSLDISKEFKRIDSELRNTHIQLLKMTQESIKNAR